MNSAFLIASGLPASHQEQEMDILASNLLVLASAGSGKTFQLGNRILGLLGRGAPPSSIAALTFTRKAAGEFADSVLTKLAKAAADPATASSLRREARLPDTDFAELLETTVRGLPEMTFGTMDSFFASVVRGFQYELGLTGGTFDLVEGPRARLLADGLIASILGSALESDQGEEFLHAFRRATIGREEQGVLSPLRKSIAAWHELFRTRGENEWQAPPIETAEPEEWETHKQGLAAAALSQLHLVDFNRKGQREALEDAIGKLASHTIGSGSLGSPTSLLGSLLNAASSEGDALEVRHYKDFTIPGPAARPIRHLIALAARCEAGAAARRTRAMREIVSRYDAQKDLRHRRAGRLGFDDVKYLMGRWACDETARLRREHVDFRIDSRIDHWLLDEFQDTSRADWNALLPLLDEAITRNDATTFIVGDRKQAIYAWRGGDVGLFGEIMRNYHAGITVASMAESWRSSPEILSMVNLICGDATTLPAIFGPVAETWIDEWQEHISAPPLQAASRAGHACVEIVGDREARFQRLTEILAENHVGTRPLTCGILLRSNSLVREVADHLRNEGYDVIEEGSRHPGSDNQPGALILSLLRWLADPSDHEAAELLQMVSPPLFTADAGPFARWEDLTRSVARRGLAATVRDCLGENTRAFGDFGTRRYDELIFQLDLLDASHCCSAREAADWLANLEISQSPGVGAVQVMTIHKSKGLGFDLVIIPEVSGDTIPKANQFEIALGDDWIIQSPPQWARRIFPELLAAEESWGQSQRHEAICGLYVALTRAKRGLHVLLDKPSADPAKDEHPSLANWILRSTGCSPDAPARKYGPATWSASLPSVNPDPAAPSPRPQPLRSRAASRAAAPRKPSILSRTSAASGTRIHQILQSVGWLDEPVAPEPPFAGELASLNTPEIRDLLSRKGRTIRLLHEQAVLTKGENRIESGVIDRLHLHLEPSGTVHRIEIIDFKTDRVERVDLLLERHAGQLERYTAALHKIHPSAEIERVLVSTRLGRLIRF